MNRTERIVGMLGTAHGRMNSTAMILIHHRVCTKKPLRPSAITIFTLTATTRKTMVLMSVRKKIGSAASLT
jgi:hypothetical protein